GGAAQPFNVLVLARPGAMAAVAGVRPIELLTIWIGARKCRISFLSWRHRYHGGPPLIGNGPEDTDSTPVVPCYYSPGLPRRLSCPKGPRSHGFCGRTEAQAALNYVARS